MGDSIARTLRYRRERTKAAGSGPNKGMWCNERASSNMRVNCYKRINIGGYSVSRPIKAGLSKRQSYWVRFLRGEKPGGEKATRNHSFMGVRL